MSIAGALVAYEAVLTSLGRYEVVRPLATGGMATVYLGRVKAAGGFERLIAIKVMHPHIANEPEFVTMFLDEARLAARIRHQNVVATHDVDQAPEGLFLVMDYVDGPPLHLVVKAVARARQPIPLGILLRIFCDVLEGLHAAHELTDEQGKPLGLVHRDVSPHNVLIGKDGVAKLTDFGVAHARTRLTSTRGTNLKGKVSYLAPEQVLVGRVDRRSDVFSAGVVLWEALTRRRLFKGQTEGQTLAQIIAGARAAPHAVDPSVPRAISDVCMRALATKPDERLQSAIEFADALEASAKASGITIGRARDVAAFLASLDIPHESVSVPVAPASSSRSASQGALSAGRIAQALAGVPTSDAPITSSEIVPQSTTSPSTTVGGSLVDLDLQAPRRSRWPWLAAAVGLLVAGVAAAAVVLPKRGQAAADAPAVVAPPKPSAAPSASARPAESAPTTIESAEAKDAPSPSSSQPSSERDEPSAPPAAALRPVSRPAQPAAAPAPKRDPKPSATSYKPSEL